MASGTLRPSLKNLSDLFGGGTAVGLSDGELLRRYATSHDGPAFEVLVARHGPMVAATCGAILHDLHDVEDAFQAAFLVLARRASSIRAGDALGGWLHRVAYRAAVQRNIEAKRRRRSEVEVAAMEIPDAGRPSLDFDVRSILHEEIDRLPESQRQPVVLCDLEGLTYEQAAGRLHCTVPTLYHRLAEGRKRLRDRLIRRGVTAAAVGAAMEISRVSATAAVPSAWATAAMAAATGGPIPAAVAALSHTLIRSLLMTRLKLMTAAILTLGTMILAGVVALGAARPDAPGPPPPAPSAASIPPPRADEPKPPASSNAQPGPLTVEARDLSTDALMADVRFEISSHDSSSAKTKTSASTDASGAARFSPPADVRYLDISASRPGFVPQVIRWDYNANSPSVPDHFLFQMERATTVSGRVLDQDQKPVAGATVVITVKKGYPKSRQWVDVKWAKTRTDADGRWSFSGVPEKPDSIELAAYHYSYLSEHDCFYLEDFKPLSALRDGSATLRLRRGTPIEVTVRSPAGQPVANAEVFYGEGRGYANALPPVKTDDQGKFTLGIKPGTVATLIARASGFGPTLQRIKIGEGPSRADLTLQPAHSLRGRVIDRQGKPIARAEVWVYWSGSERSSRSAFSSAIAHKLTTDDGGRFDWKEAPGAGAHVNISAAGFASKSDEALASDVDHEIVLIRPTLVKGTVIDRETGRPLPRFSLALAAAWKPGDPLIWQRGWDLEKDAKKGLGSFEYTTSSPADRDLLRVQADGYLPEDAEAFSPDGTPHTFMFRLTRTEPIRGTVRNPDGSPARGGFVYLVPPHRDGWIDYLSLRNDDVPEEGRSGTVHAKIGADGRFSLSPQKENFALLALADAGLALVPRGALHGDDMLRLQPWARIAGTVTIDGKPATNLELMSYDPDGSAPVAGEPRLVRQYYVKTDADGRFQLPRVMPGRLVLVRWVPNGVQRRIWPINMATVDVASGQTYNLAIGRSGRRVTGRLTLPTKDIWMIRKAEIVPKHSREKRPASIGVQVFEDGRLQAQDLRPGDYVLRIALHEPPPADACGWGRLIAAYSHEFTVSGTTDDRPIDLGSLRPVEVATRSLKVGDVAPDFTIKTLDGKDLALADFRGKFLLVDFWATWCAPCLAEMPNLDAVHKAFGSDPRFALVSVSLDEKPAEAAAFVKSERFTWRQGHVGPESPMVATYGATSIPAIFLIGPDGKILATDLRGDKLKAAVAAALGTTSAPQRPSTR